MSRVCRPIAIIRNQFTGRAFLARPSSLLRRLSVALAPDALVL
jgi:hypothetical protein